MLITLLKAKLHHLHVTAVAPEYEGSLLVDEELLEAAGIRRHEKVLVANMANGERFETYAIAGRRGGREVCLNGAAARKGAVGDRLIVMSWCHLRDDEAAAHCPRVVCCDALNNPLPR
jgi:aspartate 1-decarboxylase